MRWMSIYTHCRGVQTKTNDEKQEMTEVIVMQSGEMYATCAAIADERCFRLVEQTEAQPVPEAEAA